MKSKATSLVIVSLILISAVGCFSFNLQDEIMKISEDSVVTQKEFNNLKAAIIKSGKYKKLEGAVALHEHMIKYFFAKNMQIKLFNPVPAVKEKFNVNVFFENSFSMDGYILQADLKSSLYNLLVNVQGLTSTIRLNYINSVIIKAPNDNIGDFSTGLTPSVFKKMGGKRGNSDIAAVVKNVLSQTNMTTASILISDCVFSPDKGQNAVSYLDLQQVAIKSAFKDKLRQQNLAVVIYQMKAGFNGHYYDHNTADIPLNADRPYYIWVIGTDRQIKDILKNQIINESDIHLLNKIVLSSTKTVTPVDYKIVNTGKIGDYKFQNKNEIYAAHSQDSNFGFGVAVNFKENIRDLTYFSDPSIYQTSNSDYTVSNRALSNKEITSPAFSGFTHLLTVQTKQLQAEELTIDLLSKIPSWVNQYSSIDDSAIKSNVSEQKKTFGLKFLVGGVFDAFKYYPNDKENIISQVKIKISK